MNKKLYLGSQSHSRQELLKTAGFDFEVVHQDADEQACDWGLPLQKLLESIAIQKMQHLILPDGKDGDTCFVITADTMGMDVEGNISGKPQDRAEAIEKLKSYRAGAQAGTGTRGAQRGQPCHRSSVWYQRLPSPCRARCRWW